jgi:endo-alpha-1,4-polygalactosaminidase (GH114 family)
MLAAIFLFLKEVPIKVWAVVAGALLILSFVAYQMHSRNVAEREAEKLKKDNQVLQDKTEGLKILVNVANTAIEVEREKKIANEKGANSNAANRVYDNRRRVDSNQSTGNFLDAKRKFCTEFPDDSGCR